MPHSGYNPTRRNRNIGTSKAGRGQDNKLTIPAAWADNRMFCEKLVDPVAVPVAVGPTSLTILVEPPLSGFFYACTIEDIVCLLSLIPLGHLEDVELLVLRQPKRKERIISPVWGRIVYWTGIGKYSGPAVYLEAQDISRPHKWSKSLSPDDARELERLKRDGHPIDSSGRHHVIASTQESIRNTQLFRTLPHEIGHYVDYIEKVDEPSGDDLDLWERLDAKYHKRLTNEKEAYADRYADDFLEKTQSSGEIPFDLRFDADVIRGHGLEPAWFLPPDAV
jgi:hypothetical protein